MIPFTLTPQGISLLVDNRPRIIAKDHLNYQAVVDAVKANDMSQIKDLVDIPAFVAMITHGKVQIGDNHVVMFDGQEMHNTMTDRLVAALKQGFDITFLASFMEKLYANPTTDVHADLYTWLEKGEMPITEDGDFIAYKKVKDDYTSHYDGKTPNFVGTIVKMDRRDMADTDRNQDCSSGLHFCSYDYLKGFSGARILILKINPADVVAIPNDYSHLKGRAWKYEVLGEVPMGEKIDSYRVKPVVADDDKSFEHNKENWAEPPKRTKKAPSMSGGVTVSKSLRFTNRDGKTYTPGQLIKAVGKLSQAKAAEKINVGRSTLQDWLKKMKNS